MNTKNPTKSYLAQSVRTNGKLVLLVLLGILAAGVGATLVGIIPEHRELASIIISDLPAKIAIGLNSIIWAAALFISPELVDFDEGFGVIGGALA